MARKKTKMRGNSLFQNIQDISDTTEKGAAEAGVSYPLIEIMPDPDQPRVLLPDHLRDPFFEGRYTPQEVINLWIAEAEKAEGDAAARDGPR